VKGPFSEEAALGFEGTEKLVALRKGVTAQSVYAPEYDRILAIDGNPDPFKAWISKPYGGGTNENPKDVWWSIEFPGKKTLEIKGVKIICDHRDVIPLQRNLQVQIFTQGEWKTAAEIRDAREKDIVASWPEPISVNGIRILVPAADLLRSDRADVDRIVRICELLLVLPDGREAVVMDFFDGKK
jgi:hypothetical protein